MMMMRVRNRVDCFDRLSVLMSAARAVMLEQHNADIEEARARRG